ncbi:MAG TPA: hypothetical protein VM095_02595 [Pyrinomonadaceae bacterium]|nr:hypothetical protein [Pyrinomonadaceae bacterium]
MSFSEALAESFMEGRKVCHSKEGATIMRWITRHVVFTLCFSLGSTVWYILAHKQTVLAQQPALIAEKISDNQAKAQLKAEPQEQQPVDEPIQSIKFGPIEPITGYVNTKTLILRESADANAPIKSRLKTKDYTQLMVLGATPDFLHVKITINDEANGGAKEGEQEFEGWTTWDSVVMDLSAIVLDAETGQVVSRVPLHDGLYSVTFSPDGSRALFFRNSDAIGGTADEVRTSDYTLTRSLTAGDNTNLGTLFYGPADGDLYAAVQAPNDSPSPTHNGKAHLMRLGEGGAERVPLDFRLGDINFGISRDGLLGFIMQREAGNFDELMVDVIELSSMKVRNTFILKGDSFPADSTEFVLNREGSELYARLTSNASAISVIDTRNGQFLRELQAGLILERSYFGTGSLLGDSLLLRVWYKDDEDDMHSLSRMHWAGASGLVAAERGVDYVTEAGAKRYAVNDDGTRLFKLDSKNHIQESIRIARPELHRGATSIDGLGVFGLQASRDGKRLIMFVGIYSGC